MWQMARIIFMLTIVLAQVGALYVPQHHSDLQHRHIPGIIDVPSKRAVISPPDGPVRQEFDFTNTIPGRQILLGDGSGMTLTCIDCSIEGRFELSMDFAIDNAVVDEIVTAVSSAQGAASTVASFAASIADNVGDEATSVVGEVGAGASAIATAASSIANSVVASAAPPVVSAVTEAASAVVPVASEVRDVLTDLIPGILGGRRRDIQPHRRQAPDLLAALQDFNISMKQLAPFRANFNLEFSTDDDSVALELVIPVPVAGIPSIGPPLIPIGPISLGLVLQPLGVALSAALQPNMNVTFPFGADITFNRPLLLSGDGVQNAELDVDVRQGTPVMNQFDPSLCLSAALGPMLKFTLLIPGAETGIEFDVQLELPKATLCFNDLENVDEQCEPGDNISDALNINSSISIGLKTEFAVSLPAGLDNLLPNPPQLPELSKEFPLLNQCLDLGSVQNAPDDESVTLDVAASTSQVSAPLTATGSVSAAQTPAPTLDPSALVSASTTLRTTAETKQQLPSTTARAAVESNVQSPNNQIVTVTVTASKNATVQDARDSDPALSIKAGNFDEPLGKLFSLPTGLAEVDRQFKTAGSD